MQRVWELEEVGACELCGGSDARQVFHHGPFGVRRCRACGLNWLSPRIAEDRIGDYYNSETDDYNASTDDLETQLRNPTFAFRGQRLESYTTTKRLFEIGCGDGNFLAFMKRRGWTVSGSEVRRVAIDLLRDRHGIEGILADPDATVPTGTWEAVGMYHVLEHLYHPRRALEAIHAAVIPKGLLHVQVPNISSGDGRIGGAAWAGLAWPRHAFHFGPSQLKRLLQEEGFRVVSIKTYDPWHGPGMVAFTLRGRLRSIVSRSPSASANSAPSESGQLPITGRPDPRLAPAISIINAVSRPIAQFQSWFGWGNIIDAIGVRV
jgi:SAM-dependent methyltransferase